MATILIVDDDAKIRQFVVTVLGCKGHRFLEASDGAEALHLVHAARPDLVITEILRPTADGYEFVRQMRSDPAIAATRVIFFSASFHSQEAQALARACGVLHLLSKPASPDVFLQTVEAALAASPPPASVQSENFDREHLRLLTDRLAQEVSDLSAVNARLAAILELTRQLALEPDQKRLLEAFCQVSRTIVGARYASLGMLDIGRQEWMTFFTSGIDPHIAACPGNPSPRTGLLAQLLAEGQPLRLPDIRGELLAVDILRHQPEVRSFLGLPISTPSQTYGVLYFTEKIGAEEFGPADEQVAAALAAQLGVAYENLLQHKQIHSYAGRLEESGRRFKGLFENAQDAILLANDEAQFVEANPAACALLGYRLEELAKLSLWDVTPLANRGTGQERWQQLLATGRHSGEYTFLRKDGTTVEVDYRAVASIQPGLHLAILRDITGLRRAYEGVRQSEERFRLVVESAPCGMVMVNPQGRIILVNEPMERMFNYRRDELLGQPIEILVPEPLRERHPTYRAEFMASPQTRPMGAGRDLCARRKYGDEFPIEIGLTPIETEEGTMVLASLVDISERKRAEGELKESARLLHALSRKLLEAQEDERRRLAHELHDEIGQVLTSVSLTLQGAMTVAGPAAQPRLEEGHRIIDRAIQQVRDLSLDLRPAMLDLLGLEAALDWYAERQGLQAGFTVHFVSHLEGKRPLPELEIAAFRIAQEAMTNVARYAKAQHVWIEVVSQEAGLQLVIRDDGIGFDTATAQQRASRGGSFGLLGMQERAHLLGGQFDIDSAPGRGTTVHLSIPWPDQDSEGAAREGGTQ